MALKPERHAEAVGFLERVEQQASDRPNLQYLLALAHAGAGDSDRAAAYFQRCLELPNRADYAKYCQRNSESRLTRPAASEPR